MTPQEVFAIDSKLEALHDEVYTLEYTLHAAIARTWPVNTAIQWQRPTDRHVVQGVSIGLGTGERWNCIRVRVTPTNEELWILPRDVERALNSADELNRSEG